MNEGAALSRCRHDPACASGALRGVLTDNLSSSAVSAGRIKIIVHDFRHTCSLVL
jgi:hypothetical protein